MNSNIEHDHVKLFHIVNLNALEDLESLKW